MKHIVTWCEIPVTDMARAKAFYSEVFDVSFTDDHMDGFDMAMFNADPDLISGALVKGPDYNPSKDGAIVYLNAGEDLSPALARAVNLGREVIWPKTAIKDGECGYFAQILDTEGNRVGLYSLK